MVIIGGGFSGTMLAAQLARRGLGSQLVEAKRPARGAAYSTDDPSHLLNVRAGNMSAWPDRPAAFVEALGDQAGDHDGFARRTDYGDYLVATLDEAGQTGLVSLVEGRAVSARPGEAGWVVMLDDGREVRGRLLALATGNSPPVPIAAADDEAAGFIVDDPWSGEGRARVAAVADAQAPIVVVGTGLTMVDVVLSLRSRGHRGPIIAVSRRGLLPRAHGPAVPPPAVEASDVPARLGALLRWIRARAGQADWRGVVDSLRPHSQRLWQGFSAAERSRFLRHARPWWDVHRHRLAPSVAAEIDRARAEGQLEVIGGRVERVEPEGARLAVTIHRRGDGRTTRPAALLVNCTGPRGPRADDDPLIGQLVAEGLAAIDPLGLGFDIDEHDRLSGRTDAWALGPPTKGRYWEITAVPDIRVQAERVAERMAASLRTAR